ncbi:MAG: Xaa-Pro dipeptidase [Gaiellaceae bacterium]|nr:Xaa-Pro dipeptidase [Gaiellaceae bacterium]
MNPNAERALAAVSADVLVTADPFCVGWLTGFAADATSGPSAFAVPPIAVVSADGVILLCSTDEEPGVDPARATTVAYEGFTTAPLDPAARQLEVLAGLGLAGRIAIEAHALSAAAAAVLPEARDVGAALRGLRAVKTPDELAAIRRAIAICDAGQAAARAVLRPGISELAAWNRIAGAMEAAAGERLPLLCDLVSGPRTADVGGYPGERVIASGELVLCDLVPRTEGVYGDSCSTIAVGEPPAGVRDAHARAVDTLEQLLAAVKPGVLAADLDRLGRSTGLDYPHHTGHGIGYAGHEEPRIVPDSETVLEPGMVVALEPGTYPGPWGLRVERVCVVTETGCEVLSRHEVGL